MLLLLRRRLLLDRLEGLHPLVLHGALGLAAAAPAAAVAHLTAEHVPAAAIHLRGEHLLLQERQSLLRSRELLQSITS